MMDDYEMAFIEQDDVHPDLLDDDGMFIEGDYTRRSKRSLSRGYCLVVSILLAILTLAILLASLK